MRYRSLIALACVALFIVPALAGPPLVCHPVDVAGHQTLPWGRGAFDTHVLYPCASVIPDTLARLTPDTPILVRMETLRRAGVYLKDDDDRRGMLLQQLQARILDAEASGRPDALAWFDAGFLAQVYHQYAPRSRERWACGSASGVAGYGWVKKAIALRGDDAQMELAAALMTVMEQAPLYRDHLERAQRGAAGDELLSRNIKRLMPVFLDFKPELRHGRRG